MDFTVFNEEEIRTMYSDMVEKMSDEQKQIGEIQKKIAEKIGTDVDSFEIKELIGEYDNELIRENTPWKSKQNV